MQTSATGLAIASAACLLVLVIVLAVISPPPKVLRTVSCPVPQTYAGFTADEAAKFLNEYPECSYLAKPSPS
jgi:hypothetical protein